MSLKRIYEETEERANLRKIAESTVATIKKGSFTFNNVVYNILPQIEECKYRTRYFPPDSLLSEWSQQPVVPIPVNTPSISFLEISTIDGARYLSGNPPDGRKVGVLNFASATKPGGGFLSGAQAQEESIARSSTLSSSLLTRSAQRFYILHKDDPREGYYSHAMILSPGVVILRDDRGDWIQPFTVDVVTSPAVNAGTARKSIKAKVASAATEMKIEKIMKARMGRILYLFEKEGIRKIVLGSFGTGVFQNDVEVVASLWADLLTAPNARFRHSFDHIVFAILGHQTFTEFEKAFADRTAEVSASANIMVID